MSRSTLVQCVTYTTALLCAFAFAARSAIHLSTNDCPLEKPSSLMPASVCTGCGGRVMPIADPMRAARGRLQVLVARASRRNSRSVQTTAVPFSPLRCRWLQLHRGSATLLNGQHLHMWIYGRVPCAGPFGSSSGKLDNTMNEVLDIIGAIFDI